MRISKWQIKCSNYRKINKYKTNYTEKEIDVIFWITRRQDAYGCTFGIKYYDVCTDTSTIIQEYYNCISGLENKKFLRTIKRNSQQGWDIEILGNVFATSQYDKKRYLNTLEHIIINTLHEKGSLEIKLINYIMNAK